MLSVKYAYVYGQSVLPLRISVCPLGACRCEPKQKTTAGNSGRVEIWGEWFPEMAEPIEKWPCELVENDIFMTTNILNINISNISSIIAMFVIVDFLFLSKTSSFWYLANMLFQCSSLWWIDCQMFKHNGHMKV